jgi:hypothetical protein
MHDTWHQSVYSVVSGWWLTYPETHVGITA